MRSAVEDGRQITRGIYFVLWPSVGVVLRGVNFVYPLVAIFPAQTVAAAVVVTLSMDSFQPDCNVPQGTPYLNRVPREPFMPLLLATMLPLLTINQSRP